MTIKQDDAVDTSFWGQLKSRQLVFQATADDERLASYLESPKVFYCGFEPSGDSLHVGHLLQLMIMKRWQNAGHKPIIVVGGATGMIGDPSFKSLERHLLTDEQVAHNVKKLRVQLKKYLHFGDDPNGATLVNNYEWTHSMNVIDFLRDVGKHFSVNTMLNRDSVQQRLGRDGSGLSFTEFSYSLLQGFDFYHLYKHYGCTVQLGGSDQWGNIVSGIDYTRRRCGAQVFGLTSPLIVKADGTKFGKTESGAVWLDPEKTSPYMFYQFWINTADADVYRFLMQFTFLPPEQIVSIQRQDEASTEKPKAQQILAEEVTAFVHGTAGLHAAQRITAALFGGDVKELAESDLEQLCLDGLPRFEVKNGVSLVDALVQSGLAQSRRSAREFIQNKAVRANSESLNVGEDYALERDKFLYGRYLILQRGRKSHVLLVLNPTL